MNKFQVPFPDDETIKREIQQIVKKGIKPKPSFMIYIKQMHKQIGLRYLFVNQWEGGFVTLSVFIVLMLFFNEMVQSIRMESQIYPIIFLISPLLYTVLSIYDFSHKRHHETYEVEMVAKYNVFQLTAYKMIVFSVLTILINSICIGLLAFRMEEIHFIQGILISTTSLFLFSILFLACLMKRPTAITAGIVNSSWVIGHLILIWTFKDGYRMFLQKLPPIVYLIVITLSIVIYICYLQKLVQRKQVEGV